MRGIANRCGMVLMVALLLTITLWGAITASLYATRLQQHLANAHQHATIAERAMQAVMQQHPAPIHETLDVAIGACHVQLTPLASAEEPQGPPRLWVSAHYKTSHQVWNSVLHAIE